MRSFQSENPFRWEGVNDAYDLPGCSLLLCESFAFFASWPWVQTLFLVLCFLCTVSLGAVVGTEHYSGVMAGQEMPWKRNVSGSVCSDSLWSKHRSWAEMVCLKACSYERVATLTCPAKNCFALLLSQVIQILAEFNLFFFSFPFIHSNTASLVFIWFKRLFRLASSLTLCSSWQYRVSGGSSFLLGECFTRGGGDLPG